MYVKREPTVRSCISESDQKQDSKAAVQPRYSGNFSDFTAMRVA